jgi:hypothetical protein
MQLVRTPQQASRGLLAVDPDVAKVSEIVVLRKTSVTSV